MRSLKPRRAEGPSKFRPINATPRADGAFRLGADMKTFLMLHGINHNMFGKRDPKQYGTITLEQIGGRLQALAKELGVKVVSFQTNREGEMCERIHQAYKERVDG